MRTPIMKLLHIAGTGVWATEPFVNDRLADWWLAQIVADHY